MDEKTSSTSVSTEQIAVEQKTATPERAGTEHREAYGTAKTENLRDSGVFYCQPLSCCAVWPCSPFH